MWTHLWGFSWHWWPGTMLTHSSLTWLFVWHQKVECASMKRMMIIISDKMYAGCTLGFTLKKDGGIMLYCRCVANIRGDGLSSMFREQVRRSSSHGARSQLGDWRQVGSPPLTIRGTISCDHVVPESSTGEFLWLISLIFDRCLILFRSTGTEILYIYRLLVDCL